MIKNYIVSIYRGLKRNIGYSLINVGSLSLGIACSLLIFLVIRHELSFDTFHEDGELIYRVNTDEINADGVNPVGGGHYPLAKAFRTDFPNIKSITNTKSEEDRTIKVELDGKRSFYKEDYVGFVEPQFLEMFAFTQEGKWLAGDPNTALRAPGQVILTRSLVKKYFGNENYLEALGKTIEIGGAVNANIVGVVEDFPTNTDFVFRMLISFTSLEGYDEFYSETKWSATSGTVQTYIKFNNINEISILENQIPDFTNKYLGENATERIGYKLQPLNDIHFDSVYSNYAQKTISKKLILTLAVVGLFLLLSALANFINMATAVSMKRYKAIAMRKVLGSKKGQIMLSFLLETFTITLLAAFVGLVLSELFLVNFGDLVSISGTSMLSIKDTYFFLLLIVLIVPILAGIYPALVLSRLKASAAIRSGGKPGSSRVGMIRNVLTTFQFVVSIALISSTLIISEQMGFLTSKPLGFDKEAIMLVPLNDNNPETTKSIRSRLMSKANIENVTFAIGSPTSVNNLDSHFSYDGIPEGEELYADVKIADEFYVKTYGLNLLAGTDLDEFSPAEGLRKVLVNEALLKTMGIDDPQEAIGKKINMFGGKRDIVGVIENFHVHSLEREIQPVVLINFPNWFYEVGIKISSLSGLSNTIKDVQTTWNEVFPGQFFEYSFLDDYVISQYQEELRLSELFKIFTLITFVISCLGLYGLITFMVNQRVKEIGIRKVLGATVSGVVTMLYKRILILLLLSFLIAAPLSGYFMSDWLEAFAYQIDVNVGFFALALMITLGISVFTVGFRSLKAAKANPVDSLRSE